MATATAAEVALERQARLVRALVDQLKGRGKTLETHISYVLLTGGYAYKIKKPVDLGFLDFSTLEKRRTFCEKELSVNRRLAPDLYLDVVPITGSVTEPRIGGSGRAIEYAVKMRAFPQDALLSRMLSRDAVEPRHMDALAATVAQFHQSIDVSRDGRFGAPADVRRLAIENFETIRPVLTSAADIAELGRLWRWTDREFEARSAAFERRRLEGFVRECHGDLHANNIAIEHDRVTIFDAIEFNDEIRWIDMMSEVAFTVMDLQDRHRPDLAFRFLNAYLERTGDYDGVDVLRFYLVYRAMVRAKIAAIRAEQLAHGNRRTALPADYREYTALAAAIAGAARGGVVIMHGPAGSGKTTVSQTIVESLGAIRIRTDVERKRLAGLASEGRTGSPVGGGLYTAAHNALVYNHLLALACRVARTGYIAVVDGTFLKRDQRTLFRGMAADAGVPFAIVDCVAPEPELQERVARRLRQRRDASEADLAVLDHQLTTTEEFGHDEVSFVVRWQTGAHRSAQIEALSYLARLVATSY